MVNRLWHKEFAERDMKGKKMLDQFENNTSNANDITLRHLETKLKRFETRIQQPTATKSDYFTYDRLTTQLAEARTYLQ